MAGIISSVVSALQGAMCWSTDSIAAELSWADTWRQETLYITLSEKHTSYNFNHYVTSRYNIKSFWNESPIAEQLSLTLDLSRCIHSWLDKGQIYLMSNMQSYWIFEVKPPAIQMKTVTSLKEAFSFLIK